MSTISDIFAMQPAKLSSGEDRLLGKTTDGLAILEVVGKKEDITEVSLMMAVPKDAPQVYRRNSEIMRILIQNIFDENDPLQWVANATSGLVYASNMDKLERRFDNKMVTVQKAMPLGYLITIKVSSSSSTPTITYAGEGKDPMAVKGVLEGDEPLALIGDRIYSEGAEIGNLRVTKIGGNYVEFITLEGNKIRKEVGK